MESVCRASALSQISSLSSSRKHRPTTLLGSSFTGLPLKCRSATEDDRKRLRGAVTCSAFGPLKGFSLKQLPSTFGSQDIGLRKEGSGRGGLIVCQSLKMEDKYKNLKARRILKEMEELRDRGYDRNGRSTPWGKTKKPKGAGNEGKTKSEMDGNHNGIATWDKRMRINYGDDVEEQDYGLDYWEDDKRNVAAMRGQFKENVKKGGGTYGGQFARDNRGSKRTIIDTADMAKLVAERPGTKAALNAGVAGYYDQFAPEVLEKGSALFEDPAEVQQRMGWYLESIGVDVEAIDLSRVPGTGEEQEEKVEYLKGLGLAQEDVADIIGRWPQLLRLSLRKNIRPVIKYLQSNWIAFEPDQLVALLNKYPEILYHSIELTLQPRILYLRGVGLTRSQSRDVLLSVPSLFDTKIERSPSTSLSYLAAIGVEMGDMWKVAYGCPEILVRKVTELLKPRYEGIATTLDLSEEEARKALLLSPELLMIDDLKGLRDELQSELYRRGLVSEDTREESPSGENLQQELLLENSGVENVSEEHLSGANLAEEDPQRETIPETTVLNNVPEEHLSEPHLTIEEPQRELVLESTEVENVLEEHLSGTHLAEQGVAIGQDYLLGGEEVAGNVGGGVASEEGERSEESVSLQNEEIGSGLTTENGFREGGFAETGAAESRLIGERQEKEGIQIDVNRMVALFGRHLHADGVKATLDKTVGLLESELGLTIDELRSVLVVYPALLELESDDIRNKVEALRKEGLGLEEVRAMVVADPDWLGVEMEGAFTPKLEFLKEMGRSVNELVDFPNFLCYSLPRRIAVRHESVHEITETLPLRSLIGSSWSTFHAAVEMNEWDHLGDSVDLAEEAWTLDRAYAKKRWEAAKVGAGPVGGLT